MAPAGGPDVATVAESGIASLVAFEAISWNALLAPRDTPSVIVARLNAEINAIFLDAGVKKRFADAEKQFQKAISMNPNDPNLHVELGKVYSALEKSDKEIAEYKEAIQLNPSFADAHLFLGLTAFQKFHNTTLALDEYAILKELDKEKAHELFAVIYK